MSPPLDASDPIARFRAAFQAAVATGMENPEAMVLATVGRDGRPAARVVLLKGFDERGFVFYTNLRSRKGRELEENARVALDLYWRETSTQVVIEGLARPVTDDEADAYFASRPRQSQLGAHASLQSEPLPGRLTLLRAYARAKWRYAGRDVPRPGNWSGFRVEPERIEFWHAGAWRLHERSEYVREGDGWTRRLLYP